MTIRRASKWAGGAGLILITATTVVSLSRSPHFKIEAASTQLAPPTPSSTKESFVAGIDSWEVRLVEILSGIPSESDPSQREEWLQNSLNGIAAADLPAAVLSLQKESPTAPELDLQARLIRQWAATDPGATAAWVSRMPEGEIRQKAIIDVTIAWANVDLSAASQWALALTAEERIGAVAATATEAIRTSPREALALARELSPSEARTELITHAAGEWAIQSPQDAADWGLQIEDRELRQHVLGSIATSWGETDPAAAAGFALETLAPNRTLDDALVAIVQRWAQKDPAEATKWVSTFPQGPLREAALENVQSLAPSSTLTNTR